MFVGVPHLDNTLRRDVGNHGPTSHMNFKFHIYEGHAFSFAEYSELRCCHEILAIQLELILIIWTNMLSQKYNPCILILIYNK
jgi:hypothetical protein